MPLLTSVHFLLEFYGRSEDEGFIVMLLLLACQTLQAHGHESPKAITLWQGYETSHPLNKWSPVATVTTNSNVPRLHNYWRDRRFPLTVPVASYQRVSSVSIYGEHRKWKIMTLLPLESASETWVYDFLFGTWNRPRLKVQPTSLGNHTVTTWCDTNVILFGGQNEQRLFNETWLFDSDTEIWQRQDVNVWTKVKFLTARILHTAVTIKQPQSNCTCQESILVYGGLNDEHTCLGDLWELRCIADSNGRNTFVWIPLLDELDVLAEWPQKRSFHNAADYDKTVMYMWGGYDFRNKPYSSDIWEYNLTSRIWNRFPVLNMPEWPEKLLPSFFVKGLDRIVTFTDDRAYCMVSSDGFFDFQQMTLAYINFFFTMTCFWYGRGLL